MINRSGDFVRSVTNIESKMFYQVVLSRAPIGIIVRNGKSYNFTGTYLSENQNFFVVHPAFDAFGRLGDANINYACVRIEKDGRRRRREARLLA